MIPAFLVREFGPKVARLIVAIAFFGLLILVLGVAKCSYDRKASTEVKLSRGQTGAAIDSGADAVQTVGNRMQADAAGEQTVQETKNAIDHATDAGGVTDAGRAGLCRLASHRSKPECLR